MTIYEYGNPDADTVLIQLTGDHELSVLKNEVEEIRKRTSTDFRLIAAKVDDWNYELSPWKAPYFPALQLLHRLSGFRDLLSI